MHRFKKNRPKSLHVAKEQPRSDWSQLPIELSYGGLLNHIPPWSFPNDFLPLISMDALLASTTLLVLINVGATINNDE